MNDDLNGIKLEGPFYWEVSGYDAARTLLALPRLAPAGSVAYFEGCGICDEVRNVLSSNHSPITAKVYRGTIVPTPEIFHVPLNPTIMTSLAQIIRERDWLGLCDHLHVYKDNIMLMDGHDFSDLPLCLSSLFSEQEIAFFCHETGAQYSRVQPSQ